MAMAAKIAALALLHLGHTWPGPHMQFGQGRKDCGPWPCITWTETAIYAALAMLHLWHTWPGPPMQLGQGTQRLPRALNAAKILSMFLTLNA